MTIPFIFGGENMFNELFTNYINGIINQILTMLKMIKDSRD